jgi:hypothetical protein
MLVAHVREVNEVVNARTQVLATCASNFGVSMFLPTESDAVAFAETIKNNISAKIFSNGDKVSVDGKEVLIAPANRQYGDKEVAQTFCEEFFRRFTVPVVGWLDSINYR